MVVAHAPYWDLMENSGGSHGDFQALVRCSLKEVDGDGGCWAKFDCVGC